MKISNLIQPQYLFRPQQVVIRLIRGIFPPKDDLQEIVLPWGMKIKVNIKEAVGEVLWYWGVFELEASEVLWRLINPGDFVVDAGANVGYMTSIMARRCGPFGTVLAFEPQPFIHGMLKVNVDLFSRHGKSGKIRISDRALSNTEGEQFLVSFDQGDMPDNWGTSRLSDDRTLGAPVGTTTLDAVAPGQDIAVLKMDVEGHELQVLQGARNLLRGAKVRHIVYEHHASSGETVHEYLKSSGYTIYYISWEIGGVVLVPLEAAVTLKPGAPNYLATLEPERVVSLFKPQGWKCLS